METAADPNAPAAEPDGSLVAVFYAPDEPIAQWVEDELEQDGARIQVARSLSGLVKALVEDPSPRPHILIIDVDALEPVELMQLHSIRHLGWFGSIIALGSCPAPLRASLSIDHVLIPPYGQNKLRDLIAALRSPVATVRIPVMHVAG